MSYVHTGLRAVVLTEDPIDPDSTDWVVFSYGDELLAGETITSHAALVSGGTIVTDSSYIGTMTDKAGVSYEECYGVQFSVDPDVSQVSVTHRTSRNISGTAVLGRENLDRTAIVPVRPL